MLNQYEHYAVNQSYLDEEEDEYMECEEEDEHICIENGKTILNQQLLMHIAGTAGTGKSYLINGIQQQQELQKCIQTLGTTGIASFHVNGVTMHSLLRLPIKGRWKKPIIGAPLDRLQQKLKNIKYIIIDEISMCSQQHFEWIDKRLRQASGRMNAVFGGYNIILVGDFAQLPPVLGTPLYKKPAKGKGSMSGYLLYKLFKTVIVLDQVKRQDGDHTKQFLNLLYQIRNRCVEIKDWKYLMERVADKIPASQIKSFNNAVRIMSTNKACADHNFDELKKLKKPIAQINAIHSPAAAKTASPDKARGLVPILHLAIGSRVMLTTNLCPEKGLANGAFGTVKAILYKPGTKPAQLPEAVIVQFDEFTGSSIIKEPRCVAITSITADWYYGSESYSRQQLPLKLAWAITIHKSQGQTISKCVIDLGPEAFAKGKIK